MEAPQEEGAAEFAARAASVFAALGEAQAWRLDTHQVGGNLTDDALKAAGARVPRPVMTSLAAPDPGAARDARAHAVVTRMDPHSPPPRVQGLKEGGDASSEEEDQEDELPTILAGADTQEEHEEYAGAHAALHNKLRCVAAAGGPQPAPQLSCPRI
jgi:hypothetical protein